MLDERPIDPELEANTGEDEYEEISSEEVDRVVAALEELMTTVQSENILTSLEEAADEIFHLVYEDSDLEDVSEDVSDQAA